MTGDRDLPRAELERMEPSQWRRRLWRASPPPAPPATVNGSVVAAIGAPDPTADRGGIAARVVEKDVAKVAVG
jgi:hypothetical protein